MLSVFFMVSLRLFFCDDIKSTILESKYRNVDLFFNKSESKHVEMTIEKNQFGLETITL